MLVSAHFKSDLASHDMIIHEPPSCKEMLAGSTYSTLMVSSSRYWEYCSFIHPSSGKSCNIQWNEELDNVTMLDCDAFEGRFAYLGDWDVWECTVRFTNLQPCEFGEWQCVLEEYSESTDRDIAQKASMSFHFRYWIQKETYAQNMRILYYLYYRVATINLIVRGAGYGMLY